MAEGTSADDLFNARDPDEMRGIAANLWTIAFRAGDAYGLGGPEADPNGCADDLGGQLMIPAKGEQRVAIYRMPDGRAILVAATLDGLWGVDLLPHSARDEFVRPGGTLMDDQEYEELQLAAEETAAVGGIGDEWERVLAGPESSGVGGGGGGRPHIADPMEDAELPEAAADTVRGLLDEMADTEREYGDVLHPDGLDPKLERKVLDGVDRDSETSAEQREALDPSVEEIRDRRP